MAERSRIVEAMIELTERRDAGELIDVILSEVADDHEVSLAELTHRAETSWGMPLETDSERHAAHFEHVSNAREVAREARELAREIYEANIPSLKEFSFWEINWSRELEEFLKEANLADPALERIAREEFMDAANRFNKAIKIGRT